MTSQKQKNFDLKFILGAIVLTILLMAVGIIIDNTCCEKPQRGPEIIV